MKPVSFSLHCAAYFPHPQGFSSLCTEDPLTPQLHSLCSDCKKWAVSPYRDKENKYSRYGVPWLLASQGFKRENTGTWRAQRPFRSFLVMSSVPWMSVELVVCGSSAALDIHCREPWDSLPSPLWLMTGWATTTLGTISGAVRYP